MLNRRLFLLALLVASGGGAASLPAQLRRNPLPSDDELARYGLMRAWWNQAVFNPYRDKIRAISTDEQAVYVQSTSGNITAFDSETGRLMWSKLVGSPDQVSYPLTSNDSTIFMAVGMNLYAVDKPSGETIWSVRLDHHPSTSPEVDEDQAYVGTTDGSIYCLDLRKIKELYDRRLLPQYSGLTVRWRYQAPSEIVSPPISNGEAVVFASFTGLLYSVVAKDGVLNYQFETEGSAPIRVPVGRSQNTIFVASDDDRVFALDMINGNRRWSFTAGQPVRQQPRVVGNSVFIVPSGSGMYSLRTMTGFQNWRQREATEFLAATPETVYASDRVGNVLILNRVNGAVIGSLPYGHLNVRVQNERTDRLYLASSTGLIVCIRERSREQPLWHMFPDRQPIRAELAPDVADTGEPAPEGGNPFATP